MRQKNSQLFPREKTAQISCDDPEWMCVSVCVHVLHLLAEEEPSGPVNDLCQLGRLRSQLRSPASGASKSSPLSVSASQWCHQPRAWQAESHSLSSTSDMADTHTDTYNVLVTVRITQRKRFFHPIQAKNIIRRWYLRALGFVSILIISIFDIR